MDFVESFEKLKVELREKWLSYYQENQNWIEALNLYRDTSWTEKERTYNHYFLLGVLSALEPEFARVLPIFAKLSSDPRRVVKLLQISDLDLKQELEQRLEQRAEIESQRTQERLP